MTAERGLKNPIQRTTFYLQRRSGARVMTCFVVRLMHVSRGHMHPSMGNMHPSLGHKFSL